MLANVQQKTIQPIVEATIETDTIIYIDEDDIYAWLGVWDHRHKAACHGRDK